MMLGGEEMQTQNFDKLVLEYIRHSQKVGLSISKLDAEVFIEKCLDCSALVSLEEVQNWFRDCADKFGLDTETIPLNDCRDWFFDDETGSLMHVSKDFFRIEGVRVLASPTREVQDGWDQPIVTQIGFDGGVLGLLRAKSNGHPHYLVEAKAEPGNPDLVQISPTLQATFANLKRTHGGRQPHFAEYFDENYLTANHRILFNQWFSEDGGRLNKKRNKGVIVQLDENDFEAINENLPDGFKWMTLFQIRHFLKTTSWISPHLRSLVAAL